MKRASVQMHTYQCSPLFSRAEASQRRRLNGGTEYLTKLPTGKTNWTYTETKSGKEKKNYYLREDKKIVLYEKNNQKGVFYMVPTTKYDKDKNKMTDAAKKEKNKTKCFEISLLYS